MPTYEYRCQSCGERVEAVQSFTDAPLTVCSACGAADLRKLFGNIGVVFKGSGFYRNDSRNDGKSGSGGSTTGDNSVKVESSTGGSGSSDGGTSSEGGRSSDAGKGTATKQPADKSRAGVATGTPASKSAPANH